MSEPTTEQKARDEARRDRHAALCKRTCDLMGWTFARALRADVVEKVRTDYAVAVSLDKLEAMLDRIERGGAGSP